MEAMSLGYTVPIYTRARPHTSRKKKTPSLEIKETKGRRFRRKLSISSSDAGSKDSDTVRTASITLSTDTAQLPPGKLVRQPSIAESVRTIALPSVPPRAPLPPLPPTLSSPVQRTESPFTLQTITFPKPATSVGRGERTGSATPFTDLVRARKNSSAGSRSQARDSGSGSGSSAPTSPETSSKTSPSEAPPAASERSGSAQQLTSNFNAAAAVEPHGVAPLRISKPVLPVITTNFPRPPVAPVRNAFPPPPRHRSTSTPIMATPIAPNPSQSYPPPPPPPAGQASQANPQATFTHIQEMAQKRISTLDYLRKTHEGRVYWYNTLHFTRPDLLRLPSFAPPRLARRATNLLLLGLSLPAILDLNTTSPTDYLRTLDALLREYEKYCELHPVDGSSKSSLSRGGMNRFFSGNRMPGAGGSGKGRRSSSAADIGAPLVGGSGGDGAGGGGGMSGSGGAVANGVSAPLGAGATSGFFFGGTEQELLPGEEYVHLITPSLPFDPDFFEVFATLCDVLIDTYTRICALVGVPERAVPGVAELFSKADARLRKVIVSGVVKEFEEATKAGVKGEMRGVGRVVLGGLM